MSADLKNFAELSPSRRGTCNCQGGGAIDLECRGAIYMILVIHDSTFDTNTNTNSTLVSGGMSDGL
jgi:hypothetical protein